MLSFLSTIFKLEQSMFFLSLVLFLLPSTFPPLSTYLKLENSSMILRLATKEPCKGLMSVINKIQKREMASDITRIWLRFQEGCGTSVDLEITDAGCKENNLWG